MNDDTITFFFAILIGIMLLIAANITFENNKKLIEANEMNFRLNNLNGCLRETNNTDYQLQCLEDFNSWYNQKIKK